MGGRISFPPLPGRFQLLVSARFFPIKLHVSSAHPGMACVAFYFVRAAQPGLAPTASGTIIGLTDPSRSKAKRPDGTQRTECGFTAVKRVGFERICEAN